MQRIGPPSCPACMGGQCKGGGNRSCVQRDPQPSHIAGILDTYGGVRVVVAHQRTFKHHVRHDEFIAVVPDKLVHEPIAWGDIPPVIELGQLAIERWVERHADDNDLVTREAVRAYRSRKTWQMQRSFDPSEIVFT